MWRWLFVCVLVLMPGGASAAPDRIVDVAVEGTAFRVTLASGRVLTGRDLEGATLSVAFADSDDPQPIRLDSIMVDPHDAGQETLLYHISDPLNPGAELCSADAWGEHWAFPLKGRWDANGVRTSDRGLTLTCAADAQGKCVRFGYKPWKQLADGTSLAPYHQACIRMVRADYCGDQGITRNGMLIDYYDSLGLAKAAEPAEADAKRLAFEAAWDASGALCVAHTRVPENVSLQELAERCPRLRDRLGPEACTQAMAEQGRFGRALILDKSP
jgi:hypothetical protein